jgi:hypothetical protein
MRPDHSTRTGRRLLLGVLLLFGGGLFSIGAPAPASAHKPVVVDDTTTEVVDPEISKAYYGTLSGEPQRYRIETSVAFDLYVGILVPDDGSPVKDVSTEIFRGEESLVRLGGADAAWTSFYEPFGGNDYWEGGEYRLRAEPGVYTIIVSSINNTSSYSLAIGEIEFFSWEDRINTLALLPGIQQEFFGRSPLSLLATPYGLINLLVISGAAFAVALLYRRLLRRYLLRLIGPAGHPIGWRPRVAAAVAIFGGTIATSWSAPLLLLSGLLLFEALLGRRSGEERSLTARRRGRA